MKMRHCTCFDCQHEWDAPLERSTVAPNISGEKTNFCPTCNSRNVQSGPVFNRSWKSIALWPDHVLCGCDPNESTDTHESEWAARAVCRGLEREGLGGERIHFPISTRIEVVDE